jgi:hypothetical protein
MQFNNYSLANHQWNENMLFQPVLPVGLTKDWNLITRPVIPLYNSVPVPVQGDPTKAYNQTTAFGDLTDMELHSPAHSGPWLIGFGPTFIFPTATSRYTGQGKWQAGPAAVFGYLSKEFIVGLFPQQWWSIGGSTDRAFTSQMNLQPFAAWFFAPGVESRILGQHPGRLEGTLRRRLDRPPRPGPRQGREAGAAVRQVPDRRAVDGRPSLQFRSGMEYPDHARHPEAHQRDAV